MNSKDAHVRMENTIAYLLLGGVLLAAVVVLAGGVRFLFASGAAAPPIHTFHGVPRELATLAGILRAAAAGDGCGLIQLGVLLLLATPITRVAASAVIFARQRDRIYIALTLTVLAVLLCSLVLGHRL